MSKPLSNHFHGTTGERRFLASQRQNEGGIIQERVQGLDLNEHPIKFKSKLKEKLIIVLPAEMTIKSTIP